MRILILPSFYPTLDDFNRGIFFKEQANMYAAENKQDQVDIVYYERRSLKKLAGKISWNNRFNITDTVENQVRLYRCHAWNIIPTKYRIGQKLWITATLHLISKYLKKFGKPDIVHAQSMFYAGEVAAILYQKYKIPYIIQEHSTIVRSNHFSPKSKNHFKNIYEQAGAVVTVSQSLKLLLAHKFGIERQDIQVIPNFIDTAYFGSSSPNSSQLNETGRFVFATISYLTAKKRIDRLLSAFAKAFKGDRNIFLQIGGEGEEQQNIENLIDRLQLTTQVSLLGQLDRLGVKNLLKACDAFVLGSDIETFGVVLIESLAAGKPVLATKSGGPEDFVTQDVGLLVDAEESAIAKGLVTLRNNAKGYDPIFIKRYAEKNFGSEAIVHKLRLIYEQTMESIVI